MPNVKGSAGKPATMDLTTGSAHLQGAAQAAQDMGAGLNMLSAEVKDLNKTRLGQTTNTPPKAHILPTGPYTTSGSLAPPKTAAYEDAPNYGIASSTSTSCGTCKHRVTAGTEKDYCKLHDFYVSEDYTCDSWKPR